MQELYWEINIQGVSGGICYTSEEHFLS